MSMSSVLRTIGTTTLRYRREVQPLHFPESEPEDERVPEGMSHLILRTFLWRVLRFAYASQHSAGCDQFVYWNARSPKRNCAPDVFVKLGRPQEIFGTWKTWERGAPELIVEIVSPTEQLLTWDQKFERFYELGAREIVRFDPEQPAGSRFRVWDRIDDDLVEREITGDTTPCLTLGLWWVVRPVEGDAVGLRLARDIEGRKLLLAPEEAATESLDAAQSRIAELEAELRKR